LGAALASRHRRRRGDRPGGDEPPAARADDPPAQPRRGPRSCEHRGRAGAVRPARGGAERGAARSGAGGGPRPAQPPRTLMRIGSRRSALALAQAHLVAQLLGEGEIVPIVTGGDRGAPAEDKSRWVAELEDALLSGRIDLAVHSAKDIPGELPEGLSLHGAP